MSPYRARRVAVTSPQTRLAHAHRRHDRPWRRPQLQRGEAEWAAVVYRRQLGKAVGALVLLFVLLFGLPVVLAAFPALDDVRLAGIPASWLLLAVLPYPTLLGLAYWQLRRAERVEGPGGVGGGPPDGPPGGTEPRTRRTLRRAARAERRNQAPRSPRSHRTHDTVARNGGHAGSGGDGPGSAG